MKIWGPSSCSSEVFLFSMWSGPETQQEKTLLLEGSGKRKGFWPSLLLCCGRDGWQVIIDLCSQPGTTQTLNLSGTTWQVLTSALWVGNDPCYFWTRCEERHIPSSCSSFFLQLKAEILMPLGMVELQNGKGLSPWIIVTPGGQLLANQNNSTVFIMWVRHKLLGCH